MDVKQALAAAPLLRKAWRVMPGPLRWPLAALAVVLWVMGRRGDGSDDEAPAADA